MSGRTFSQKSVAVAILGAAFVFMCIELIPASASQPQRRDAGYCSDRGAISAASLPARVPAEDCDLIGRTVRNGAAAVTVPRPGRGMGSSALGAGESQLYVATSFDGDVTVFDGNEADGAHVLGHSPPQEPCDEYGYLSCLAPCDDGNYNNYPGRPKVKRAQPWYFKGTSTPVPLTTAEARDHIKNGTKNIVTAHNDCGMADHVDRGAPFKGGTTKGTGITTTNGDTVNKCPSPNNMDDKNVVDFGNLAGATAGYACFLTVRRRPNAPLFITKADIRLSDEIAWDLTPDDAGCTGNTYDLQGVATHERGHTFGLAHTDGNTIGDAHSQLTMFFASYPCNSYARTLGKGDVRGLNRLYN